MTAPDRAEEGDATDTFTERLTFLLEGAAMGAPRGILLDEEGGWMAGISVGKRGSIKVVVFEV